MLSFALTSTGSLSVNDFTPNSKLFEFAVDAGPSSGPSAYYAAMPEPSSYAALLGAAFVALLALRERFRRRVTNPE